MKHLFVCREYPPCAYLPGGIGTYVLNVSESLAQAGDIVHVIGHRWPGAWRLREERFGGRLIIHRIALDEPLRDPWAMTAAHPGSVQQAMIRSAFPSAAFAYQAALLAERLIEFENIDIVEAQEWEAPLYYLQLRRREGLGPSRKPPCVVHLHSPSERIFAANGWNTEVADYAPAAAMEAYSITHADALLAPSRFIAEETSRRYGLGPGRITVIPYPLGETGIIERPDQVWARNAVCHVGRLEARKGVLEWAQAIALIAGNHPDLVAEFAGGDTSLTVAGGGSIKRAVMDRVPKARHRQFLFHGNLDRQGLNSVLGDVSLAVVPSRWENFPNSCMEVMASGLPVIVSPHGGMTEMVEDGISGWIAADGSAEGLAATLEKALQTPKDRRREMGQNAAERIRQICDRESVTQRHRQFKQKLLASSASPTLSQWTDELPVVTPPEETALIPVVTMGQRLDEALINNSLAIAFTAEGLKPAPAMGRTLEKMYRQDPTLAVASAWLKGPSEDQSVYLPDSPDAPETWYNDQPYPLIVLRTNLLAEQPSDTLYNPATVTTIAAAALAEGATALVYPGILGSYEAPSGKAPGLQRAGGRSAMALSVLKHHLPVPVWLALCPNEMILSLGRAMLTRLKRNSHKPAPVSAPGKQLKDLAEPSLQPCEPGLVSVIIAACNAGPYIEATLASALKQTWTNLEVIVVDDGSTDDTAQRVANIAATDRRVRLFRQRNRGVAAARNRALQFARGEYIAPLDADDIWAPTKLERQIRCLEEKGSDFGFVYCWWVSINQEGQLLDHSPRWDVEGQVLEKLVEVNFVGSASVPLFRSSVLGAEGHGYDTRYRDLNAQGCEDWDLLFRMAQHHKVAYVPETLVAYRRSSGSMSSSCKNMWWSGGLALSELAARQPNVPYQAIRNGQSQLALHLAGVSFWSRRYLEACIWALRSRSPGLISSLAPHIVGLFTKRILTPASAAVKLRTDIFSESANRQPLIPYDLIYARRWSKLNIGFKGRVLRIVHGLQCRRLRLESWNTGRKQPEIRIAVTACWQFPIYSQTFVQQEVAALAKAGFKVRFFYGRLGPRSELAHPSAILWQLKRRVFLHRITGTSDLMYYQRKMPEKVEALTRRLAQAAGMTVDELQNHPHYLQAFAFTRMVEAWRADYIHSYFFYEQSLFALIAATLLELPRGVSCYADHLLDDYELKVIPLHLKDCSILVATSQRIKDELEAINGGPLNNVLVKPNAVDTQSFPPRSSTTEVEASEISLVSVCRLDPKKGLEYAIEAVVLLRSQGLPAVLNIIGLADPHSEESQRYENALRQQATAPELAGGVRFLGRCDSHEVRKHLSSARVFVAPFVELANGDKDGIPTAVLEAMAAECPIVASDAGSINEIIQSGRDGIIVPQRDAKALAMAISRLVSDPEQARTLGLQAAARARAEFDIGVCEKNLHEKVNAAVAEAGRIKA